MKKFNFSKALGFIAFVVISFTGCKPVCQTIREDLVPALHSMNSLVVQETINNPIGGEQCVRLSQLASKIGEFSDPVSQHMLAPFVSTQTWNIDGRPGPGECIDQRPIPGPCSPNMNPWRGDIGRWSCSSEGERCHKWILPQFRAEANAIIVLSTDMANLREYVFNFCTSYSDASAHRSAKDVLLAVLDRMRTTVQQHSQRVCR